MKIRVGNSWEDVGTKTNPLRVRMPDGTWLVLGGGPGQPLYLRTGSSWTKVTSGGLGIAPVTFNYSAIDVFGPNRFLDQAGWTQSAGYNYEWIRPPHQDYSAQYYVGPFSSSGLVGDFGAGAMSYMGWIGDEFNTWTRFKSETLRWYSLPVGMFMADAAAVVAALAVQNPTYATAVLAKVDVIPILAGYSVIKSQLPWMNSYGSGSTTRGLSNATGALRYQGLTHNVEHLPVTYSGRNYNLNVIRDKPFIRETSGVPIWSGFLNDLGATSSVHGLPPKPTLPLIQTFTNPIFTPSDTLLYHLQTSPPPEPNPIPNPIVGDDAWLTTQNVLACTFLVNVTYTFG